MSDANTCVFVNDVTLVSFPKSGRTWMRVMLDGLGLDLSMEHDGSDFKSTMAVDQPENCGPGYDGRRVVFLCRNPRDTVVSSYFQVTRREKLDPEQIAPIAEIGDFIRHDRYGLDRILTFNMDWLTQRRTSDFLVITYEQMHERPRKVLREMTRFLGHPRGFWSIRKAVKAASFDVMKEKERKNLFNREKFGGSLRPKNKKDPESFKVRRGQVSGYVDYMSEEDMAWCDALIRERDYDRVVQEALAKYGIDR